MHKSSLLEILRTLTKEELKGFEDFVRSPYFNKKENVLKLFLEIKKYTPLYNDPILEKEIVWKHLFAEKPYNYGIMKNLIHDLTKLCESFLSEEVYSTNDMQRRVDFFTSLFPRKISHIFNNKFESAEKVFNKNFATGNYEFVSDFYEKFRDMYDLKANFVHLNNPQNKNRSELQYLSEYLLYGFLTKCLKTFQKIVVTHLDSNHPLNSNILYLFLKDLDDNLILEHVLKYAETSSTDNYLILKCYVSMYKALTTNGSIEYYYKFKELLSESAGIISDEEAKGLYTCLLTCLTNLKITTNEFYKEYFSIIQRGFGSMVMLNKDGSITYQSFFSIVNVSLGADEIEFAENFITKYKDKLPTDLRECAYSYSMAQLHFIKKNFERSLELLITIQNEPAFLKFSMKNLQLSIYYELDDREAFDYSLDSFKHFISKNKLTNESRVLTLTQYCNYIKTLFKMRETFDAFEMSELKKKILGNKVANKKWLLEKIEVLETVNIKTG